MDAIWQIPLLIPRFLFSLCRQCGNIVLALNVTAVYLTNFLEILNNTMTQEISLKAATELVKSAATLLEKDIMSELKAYSSIDGKIICYNGDTELLELKVGEDIVIVNGNLHVTGNISDCEGVDSSLLIVLGNATCKNLITLSAMYITGDLKVAHTLFGDSLNDYSCNVGGNLEARTILEGGHW